MKIPVHSLVKWNDGPIRYIWLCPSPPKPDNIWGSPVTFSSSLLFRHAAFGFRLRSEQKKHSLQTWNRVQGVSAFRLQRTAQKHWSMKTERCSSNKILVQSVLFRSFFHHLFILVSCQTLMMYFSFRTQIKIFYRTNNTEPHWLPVYEHKTTELFCKI